MTTAMTLWLAGTHGPRTAWTFWTWSTVAEEAQVPMPQVHPPQTGAAVQGCGRRRMIHALAQGNEAFQPSAGVFEAREAQRLQHPDERRQAVRTVVAEEAGLGAQEGAIAPDAPEPRGERPVVLVDERGGARRLPLLPQRGERVGGGERGEAHLHALLQRLRHRVDEEASGADPRAAPAP
jgi:hypothetical protein